MRRGSSGPYVVVVQVMLNRISQNYPLIPKLSSVDGIFGSRTEASVRKFQEIFGLAVDGVVGKATWYEMVRLYTAVTRLSELRSLGQQFYAIEWDYPSPLVVGDRGDKIRHLQYMLSVLSAYIDEVPPLAIDGIFGQATENAVKGAQRFFGLPVTGQVDDPTWEEIYDQFAGIENTTLRNRETFPENKTANNRSRYANTGTLTQFPGRDLSVGDQDPIKQEVVR